VSSRALALTGLALALLVIASYVAAALGSVSGAVTLELDWPRVLFASDGGSLSAVIAELRLPRVLAAALTGGALALAGLILQGVSRNPLADPFLLGVSGGAGVAVVALYAVPGLIPALGWWIVPLAAFSGAQAATMLVLTLARGPHGRVTVIGLILGGIVVNAFCAAVTTVLLVSLEPLRLRFASFWLAGGVSSAEWGQLAIAAAVVVVGTAFTWARAGTFNAFALGEEGAGFVGVDTRRALREAAWTASLLAGIAVSLSGMVGYVGLIVPHVARMLVGGDFRRNVPFAVAAGALILVVGDAAARSVISPAELPVGVLTALIGTPLLFVLIRREMGRGA
jgi:iron complex transport system permease protein